MFVWDKDNLGHIARHNVSPDEAEQIIENHPLDLERQVRNGEPCILHLGETTSGRVLFVVATVRDRMLRIVTAFPANRKARKFYAEQKQTLRDKKTERS